MLQKSAVSEKAIPLFYPVARPRRWTGAGGRPTNKSPAAPGMGNCTGASAEVSFSLAQAQDAQHVRVQGVVSRSGNGVHGTSRAAQEAQSLSFDALVIASGQVGAVLSP